MTWRSCELFYHEVGLVKLFFVSFRPDTSSGRFNWECAWKCHRRVAAVLDLSTPACLALHVVCWIFHQRSKAKQAEGQIAGWVRKFGVAGCKAWYYLDVYRCRRWIAVQRCSFCEGCRRTSSVLNSPREGLDLKLWIVEFCKNHREAPKWSRQGPLRSFIWVNTACSKLSLELIFVPIPYRW